MYGISKGGNGGGGGVEDGDANSLGRMKATPVKGKGERGK